MFDGETTMGEDASVVPDKRLTETRAILAELIGFPTVSSQSNLDLIEYVVSRLTPLGARLLFSHDDSGAKANLFASFGPETDGGVVLSGHTDVVPVEDQPWTVEPFHASERDGRVYGRGSCDMKGFIACVLALAPDFAASALERPLHIALSYDEEVGCFGARVLLEQLERERICPATCIIGEPTGMRLVHGHKGVYEYCTHFRGLAGHASAPGAGVNAIHFAARYILKLLELGGELERRAPETSSFEPPASTISVGRCHGGTARNVIADACTVDWELRPVTAEDARFVLDSIRRYGRDVLLEEMRRIHPQAELELETIAEVDGLEPLPDSEAIALVRALTGRNELTRVSFGTEAGMFQRAGVSTVVCGPGSIEQAHKADEFVAVEQLGACLEMIGRLRLRLCA